jgi:hypothetical protein
MSIGKYKDLKEEIINPNFETIQDYLYEELDLNNFKWLLLIKASDLFYMKNNRFPGENLLHTNFQEDISLLKQSYKELLCNYNYKEKLEKIDFNIEIEDSFFHEFCRNSNSVIMPATSILGSFASQEIIKLITYQFKAVNNTIIYDGIHSYTSMFKL